MLQSLNWPTLQHRRKCMCLSLLYKSINGLLALKIPNYFNAISTNNLSSSTLPFYAYQNRCLHEQLLPYKTKREWSDLPQYVIDSTSLDIF